MKKLEKILKTKILAAYYGGSKGYGFANEKSDEDIIVVTEGTNQLAIIHEGIKEYIILGKEYFNGVNELSDEVSDYVAVHADVILGARNKENVIYLDPDYVSEFNLLVNEPWTKEKIRKFLLRFVQFFALFIEPKTNIKKNYHIFRVKAMIDHYIQTGVFGLNYDEPMRSEIVRYKNHYSEINNASNRLIELLDFIQTFVNKLEEK